MSCTCLGFLLPHRILPGWFYLPKFAVSVKFASFAFRWPFICQGDSSFALNEILDPSEPVPEESRNVANLGRELRERRIAFSFIIGLYK